MSDQTKFWLQVDDGEPWSVEDGAQEGDVGCGAWYGLDLDYGGLVIGAVLRQPPLYFVNCAGTRPDGSRYGFTGCYRRGEWRMALDGKPLYRVWDRIA